MKAKLVKSKLDTVKVRIWEVDNKVFIWSEEKLRFIKAEKVKVGNKVLIYRTIPRRRDGVVGELVGYRERNRRGEKMMHIYNGVTTHTPDGVRLQ